MLSTVARNGNEVGQWSAPGFPYEIEIELDVLEEIRHRAEEGFQRIGHGGVEFGGVMYGRVDDGVVRILEWRELECDHSMGPSFVLSEADRGKLASLIELPGRDRLLSGMEAVGWWASHGRSAVALKPQDVEVHERYFPGARQVALIVKPVRQGPSAVGFFGRNGEGVLQTETSAKEVEVRANVSALMRPPRATAAPQPVADAHQRVTAPASLAPPRPIGPRRHDRETGRDAGRGRVAAEAPAAAVAAEPRMQAEVAVGPMFGNYAEPKKGFRWGLVGAVLAVAALIAAAVMLIPQLMSNQPDAAGLRVEESGALLLIRWDQTIPRVRFADGGTVEITDNGETHVIRLDAEELTAGMVTYVRQGGDVKVALRVTRNGSVSLEEFARYLGPQVPPRETTAESAGALSSQLGADEQRVDEATRQEAVRKARLEESVRILENRLRQ